MVRMWLAILALLIGFGLSYAADTQSPLPRDKRWEQARNDLRQGKPAEAKAAFEDLLKDFGEDPDERRE